MKKIIKILMERDGLTEQEAKDMVQDVKQIVEYSIAQGDYEEAEEIFLSELGLEIDYMVSLLL